MKTKQLSKYKFDSTRNPNSNDDSSLGYFNGSIWLNTNTDEVWFLIDDAIGAADWIKLNSASSSTEITKVFDCDSSVSVGDIVFISTTDNKVEANINNRELKKSIGIVIEKITTETAKVLTHGECSISFSGLVRGKKVYISTSGSLTTTIPTTGYLHCIGECIANNYVYVNISNERIKLNPF